MLVGAGSCIISQLQERHNMIPEYTVPDSLFDPSALLKQAPELARHPKLQIQRPLGRPESHE